MQLHWKPELPRKGAPLYLSLVRKLEEDIAQGRLAVGTRMPTQRELADELKVAIGTVTKAFTEAERRGLIYGDGRRGTFVGEIPKPRAILASMNRTLPIGIDLSKNHPAHAFDPDLAGVLRQIIRSPRIQSFLQYPPASGMPEHLQAGGVWLSTVGMRVDPENLHITAGAQHALNVIIATETTPGDIIAAEEYTYPGVKAIADMLGLELVGVPMDAEGIITEELESLCRGRNIRLLYLNPSLQNPTNIIMPTSRREKIAELAERYNFTVVEDEILAPLMAPLPSYISQLAPERAYFVISSSKSVAAGLRLGFVVAPSAKRQKLGETLQASCLSIPPLMAEIFARWMDDGTVAKVIARRREELAASNKLAQEILSDFKVRIHQSGYHLWLELPEGWGSMAFATESQRRGVAVSPAEIFAVGRRAPVNGIRLSVGAVSDRLLLKSGLEILVGILKGNSRQEKVTV